LPSSEVQGDAPAAPTPQPIAIEEILARRSAAATEIARAQQAVSEADDPDVREHRAGVLERLKSIDGVLGEEEELATPSEDSTGDSMPSRDEGELSVFALNDLLEEQSNAEAERGRLDERLREGRDALAAAKEKLDDANRRRREAAQEAEREPGPETERRQGLRELDARLATERVHLRTLEVRTLRRQRDDPGNEDWASRIERVRRGIAEGSAEDAAGLAAVARRAGELKREREALERELATADLLFEATKESFARAAEPSAERLHEVEARASRRDAIRQRIALTTAQIERQKPQETIWKRWSAVLSGSVERDQLEAWIEPTSEWIDVLRQEEIQSEGRHLDLERRLDTLRGRLRRLPSGTPAHAARAEQVDTLDELLEAERVEAASLAYDRRVAERLLDELNDRTGAIDASEFLEDGVEAARDVWHYELAAVDDAAVTVGSLVLALMLAGIGFFAARWGASLAARVAERRLRLDAGASHALQTLAFYVLVSAATLLVLRVVHFPLTVFTFLGGALAIGVGFGSQNVMNNFISGLILMFERPVRAGDVVEVDGSHGTVERIGARSTRIRSMDGRHLIVPNSFFLESNVVNWTLSDELIRARVSVGVIYGSPTRLVETLFLRALEEERGVLRSPAPIIVFEEFGDNSLNFDAYFWVRARAPVAMKQIQSRIRFRVDDLFREHGLVIAFPQRDVHLDAVSPLRIEMVDTGTDGRGDTGREGA